MPSLVVMVDVEQLIRDYLRAHSAVIALGGDVGYEDPTAGGGAEMPVAPRWPFVNFYRIGGVPSYPMWLDQPVIQFDAWALTKQSAFHAAATVQAAIAQIEGSHPLGVVTGVTPVLGVQWLPDRTMKPARPRYVFSSRLSVHP
jgi:hypothetical protein